MGHPGVTWLLPVRDGERVLEQTLQSIAEQNYPRQEVLAWDDGSADRTAQILSSYLGSIVPGRVVSHHRVGKGMALAHLVVQAKTELLVRIDPGCTALPGRLEKQTRHMIDHRRVGLLTTPMTLADQPGKAFGQVMDDASLRWSLRFSNPVNHPAVMMRRSAVLEVGNYRSLPAGKEDYDLWARLALMVRFASLDTALTQYQDQEAMRALNGQTHDAESFYQHRNNLIDRLLPGMPARQGVQLLELVRRTDDLHVSAEDLLQFRYAAMLAAKACRYEPTFFTSTALFQQQHDNLKTRRLKGQPLIRPVWPLVKRAGKMIQKHQSKHRGNAAA